MEVIVNIIDLDHFGRGIGKINNKIIFIPYSLLGETVKAKIITDKKKYSEGILIEIIKASAKRVNSLCNYYPFCGGCQLLHLDYTEQLLFKENKIRNIFNRYGLNDVSINKIIFNDKQFNYRNKVTLHEKNDKYGYYQEKTNDLIEIDKCLLLDDKINNIIKTINGKNNIIIRSNGNEVTTDSNQKVMHTIVNKDFLVSNNSFFQVNDGVTELLYNKIVEYSNPNKNDIVLDLYCGTGTIGIFMSDYVKKVIGIEISNDAVINANENMKLNNISNIDFIRGDAGIEAKKLSINPNIIIIDPPRCGLTIETINTILDLNPQKIIYVSCDPMTLVRDLNILKEKYNILEVTPFDMFPNTYHVECITLLNRKKV